MELAIPLFALGSLYLAAKSSGADDDDRPAQRGGRRQEGFESLPNTNVPNRNFPDEYPVVSVDVDLTSKLSTVNKYDTPSVYTDKYFNPSGDRAYLDQQAASAGGGLTHNFVSLSGDKVDPSYFKHNNMVPFFGSTLRSRMVDENSNEGLLDNMIGTGTQILSKSEQSPLFSPSENMQWAHGMPSSSDFMQSRMNVSTKMSNVKPFEEERVRPGLGLEGEYSLGFNSGMMAREMWMPKTADQMRAVNKPKAAGLSLDGHEGPAMSRITNIGIHAQVEKNRPDRHFELDSSRYMATTAQGVALGQTLHALPVDRAESHRSTAAMSYVGGAAAGQEGMYVDGEYMPSKHQDLGAVPLAPADNAGRGFARDGDYAYASNRTYANNRSTANAGDYFGAMGGTIGAVVAPLLDMLRPSRKENTIGSLRPYQNPTSGPKNPRVFNPADRPGATIRETTENSNGHMTINSGQNGMGYTVSKHTQAYTTRQDTGDFEYGGIGGTVNAKQMRNYEAEYNQRNNEVKSSTINGRLAPGGLALMQGGINQRNKHLDQDLDRGQYSTAPNMPYQSPDATAMGRLAGSSGNSLYSNIQLDRNSGDVLAPLQSNPYTHNILSAFK